MRQQLIDAIWASDGHDARLVYADWLVEQGCPRGELIHLQCELESIDPLEEYAYDARQRCRELINQNRSTWFAELSLDSQGQHANVSGSETPFGRIGEKTEYRRGFLSPLRLPMRTIAVQPDLAKTCYFDALVVVLNPSHVTLDLLDSTVFQRCSDVTIACDSTEILAALLSSPKMPRLKRLGLTCPQWDAALCDALASYLEHSHVRSLWLEGNWASTETLTVAAPHLQQLSLRSIDGPFDRLEAPQLTQLDVTNRFCRARSRTELNDHLPWATVQELQIRQNTRRAPLNYQRLKKAGAFLNLTKLDLDEYDIHLGLREPVSLDPIIDSLDDFARLEMASAVAKVVGKLPLRSLRLPPMAGRTWKRIGNAVSRLDSATLQINNMEEAGDWRKCKASLRDLTINGVLPRNAWMAMTRNGWPQIRRLDLSEAWVRGMSLPNVLLEIDGERFPALLELSLPFRQPTEMPPKPPPNSDLSDLVDYVRAGQLPDTIKVFRVPTAALNDVSIEVRLLLNTMPSLHRLELFQRDAQVSLSEFGERVAWAPIPATQG